MAVYDRSKESGYIPGQARWQVRWRDLDGIQRKRAFATKRDAQAFELETRTKVRDPKRTVADQWERHIATLADRSPKYVRDTKQKWRDYVEPTWGDKRLGDLLHSDIDGWVAKLTAEHSPTIARMSLLILSAICQQATRDGVLVANPAAGIKIRKQQKREVHFLEVPQLVKLAEHFTGQDRLIVRVLGFCGMRWSELTGLDVGDLDPQRGTLRIWKVVTDDGGVIDIRESTKTEEARTIAVFDQVLPELRTHAADRNPSEPLFPDSTGRNRLRYSSFYKRWTATMKAAGVKGITPHHLRHTSASLMLSTGATIQEVQKQLGHAKASTTLDIYAHLLDRDLGGLKERMAKLGG